VHHDRWHAADRVAHGEASLGDAQADNPPDDPGMIAGDAMPLDSDVEYHGEPRAPIVRDNEDPAPAMP
jgi:hypothetical protein